MHRRRRLEPTSAAERTKLGEYRRTFESARERLRKIPDELARRLDAIASNDDLPDEGKATRSREARAEAAREVEELVAQGQAALDDAAERTRAMRVARRVRQAERDRVRALLAGDAPAAEVLKRATELGDVETVAALRGELLWAPEAPEVGALVDECDRALATLSSGDEQAENTAAVNMRESGAGFAELAQLAVKAASGKPTARDRLRLGYAENPVE